MLEILLPFYGRVDHLREAVRSVQAQTSPDWRLVVVDDAYPEQVGIWLASLGDERITYHRNERNLGFADNFQRCLALATGEHVVFLGSDDRLLPSYVDVVGRAAVESGATMVQPRVTVIDDRGRRHRPLADRVKTRLRDQLPQGRPLRGEHVATSLMHGAWTYFPSICWERQSLTRNGFDASYGLALDVALIINLLREGGTLLLLDDVLFEYRRHAASASATAALDADRFRQERAFFEHMAADLEASAWMRAARAARLHATSRLHAASILPRAVAARDTRAAGALLRHVFRR